MKDVLKKLVPFCFFIFVWFLYDMDISYYGESISKSVVSVLAFFVSLICFFLIKKTFYSTLLIAFISILVSLYNVEYLFFYVPVFIVIYMYVDTVNKPEDANRKKTVTNRLHDTLMVVSINYSVAIFVYGFIKLISYPYNHGYTFSFELSVHSLLITIALLVLLFTGYKNENKNDKKKKESKSKVKIINSINIVSVILYATQLFAYYSSAHHNGGYFGIMFFPWFMYILIVVYNDDSNYLAFINCVEAKIERFVNPKREDK